MAKAEIAPAGTSRTFRRILVNSGWLFSANAAATGLSVAQLAIVARMLGPDQYGVLAIITTYNATINQFLDSRVWETAIAYLVRYRSAEEFGKARAILKLCYAIDTLTGLVATVGIALTASWAGRVFLKDPNAAGLIQFYALSVVVAIPVGTSSAVLRVAGRFDWLAYQTLALAAARFTAVVAAALLGGGVASVLAAYVAAGLFGTMVIVWLAHRCVADLHLSQWASAPLSVLRGERRQLFGFLGATNLSALMKLLQRNADVLIVGYMFQPASAGYLRAAKSLVNLMNLPIGPVYTASYPEFVELKERKDRLGLRHVVRRVTASTGAVALAGLAVIVLGGALLIRVALGSAYLPAIPVLRWLALGMAFAVTTSIWHPLLLALGKASRSLMASTAGVVCQFAVLIVLLPSTGVTAAGMAYVAFHLAWMAVAGTGVAKGLQHV